MELVEFWKGGGLAMLHGYLDDVSDKDFDYLNCTAISD